MSDEQPGQPDPVDVRNNPESRAAQADSATHVARASDGGAPPRRSPPAGEMPEDVQGGTSEGNPVAGVTIDAEDRENAVSPDDSSTGGPTAGHA
jgi:hypothetical protein